MAVVQDVDAARPFLAAVDGRQLVGDAVVDGPVGELADEQVAAGVLKPCVEAAVVASAVMLAADGDGAVRFDQGVPDDVAAVAGVDVEQDQLLGDAAADDGVVAPGCGDGVGVGGSVLHAVTGGGCLVGVERKDEGAGCGVGDGFG